MEKLEMDYVKEYYSEIKNDANARYKSWEHCHKFFINNKDNINEDTLDLMCLHLGFYLASWGMLRNSFLQKKDYKVHYKPIKILLSEKYLCLFRISPEELIKEEKLVLLFECVHDLEIAYSDQYNCNTPSNTLITKILLGVYGCIPAYDRYFKIGVGEINIIKDFGKDSIKQLCRYYIDNREKIEEIRDYIDDNNYTVMKVIDMLFWQIGYDINKNNEAIDMKNLCSIETERKSFDSGNKLSDNRKNLGKNDVVEILLSQIEEAKKLKMTSFIITSGQLSKLAGLKNAIPTACSAIYEVRKIYKSVILHNTPSGMSSTLKVEFYLGER